MYDISNRLQDPHYHLVADIPSIITDPLRLQQPKLICGLSSSTLTFHRFLIAE